MNITDMHIRFRLGVDKAESFDAPSFEPEEIDVFLNRAQNRFVKNRYGINNTFQKGFEQTQKRTDDLRELVTSYSIAQSSFDAYSSTDNKPYGRFVSLPADYWFSIQEEVDVAYFDATSTTYTNGNELTTGETYIVTAGSVTMDSITYKIGDSFVDDGTTITISNGSVSTTKSSRVGVKTTQHDDYNRIANDPFNKPKPDQARRLMVDDKIELLSEVDFDITYFYMRYIKKPAEMLNDLVTPGNNVDCELAEHTHEEIVDIAVALALEGIESNRYQTNLNELNKNE
jgi:hypothetical protein